MARQAGEDESSTGILIDALMREARERVTRDFLEACEGDEAKRTVVLELCQKVLNDEQYSKLILAERSKDEDAENEEVDSENDEQNDDGHDENDESDEGSSDDDGIPTMTVIKGKPYKDGVSAETGELPFEEFKDLLDPDENQPEQLSRRKPSLEPNKDAKRLFGDEDAKKLVNWHHHVKNSGQLYSEEWLEGKIRDQNLEKIEKPLLLVCLQDNKIAKASTAVLGKICQGLELQPIVKKALEVWGVADKFHKVWARKPTDQYTARDIKQCRQCEIFVARAYVCISTLKHAEVSDDLGNKLLSCFVEMEKYLPQELARKRARKKSSGSGTTGTATSPFKADAKPKASSTAKNAPTAPKGDNDSRNSRAASSSKRLDKALTTQRQTSEKSATLKEATRNIPSSPKPSNQSPHAEADDKRIIEQVLPVTGEVLREFSSIEDIVNSSGRSLENKHSKKYIRRVLEGNQKSFNGFIWRYKELPTDQILRTTSEDHRKRKALDAMIDPPASKRTKPSEGEIGDASQSRNPGIQAIHPSSDGLQHLSCGASSMRAIASMPEIRESPYMKEQSAEVGEELFDSFKDLLIPRGADGRNLEASQQAKDLFGEALARQMVTASTCIAKSGMIYGNTWKDGLIQGKKCGLLSKPMLLLCLQEQRLASSSPDFLKIIIDDLGVVAIVEEVVKAWELGKDFPLLVGMKNLSALHSRTKALLGSMLFVARSYRCMVALKRKTVSNSILKKVRKCLSIVHDSLEQQVERKKRPREVTQGKITSVGHRNKPVESILQKQKAGRSHHKNTPGGNLSRVDEGIKSHETFNPGIIQHNLLLKRTNVTAKPSKEKPKSSTKPQKANKLSTPSVPATARTGALREGYGMMQDLSKKQTTSNQEHRLRQTKHQIQAQPINNLLQPGQEPSIRPSQNSRQPANEQTQKPVPTNSQETNKSQLRVAHTEPITRASTSPIQPTNAPRPLHSVSNVPIPPIESILQPAGPWYPPDQAGLLNDAETELAWLTTECSFALRLSPNTISWPFVFEYSSPLLKMELREVETNLERLVRLNDGFVRDRFKVLKAEIQKELNNGKRRPLMEKIIPLLRHRSRLANRGPKP
ncbi:MAG: hypothetical protein SGBAC_005022 [Bacillariaceae sp.]